MLGGAANDDKCGKNGNQRGLHGRESLRDDVVERIGDDSGGARALEPRDQLALLLFFQDHPMISASLSSGTFSFRPTSGVQPPMSAVLRTLRKLLSRCEIA